MKYLTLRNPLPSSQQNYSPTTSFPPHWQEEGAWKKKKKEGKKEKELHELHFNLTLCMKSLHKENPPTAIKCGTLFALLRSPSPWSHWLFADDSGRPSNAAASVASLQIDITYICSGEVSRHMTAEKCILIAYLSYKGWGRQCVTDCENGSCT